MSNIKSEISGAPPAGAGGSFPKRDIPRLAESIQPPAGAGGFLQRGKQQSLRVLIIEDSESDVALIIRELKKGGYEPEYERVETAAEMKKALKEKQWDIILCDYSMPQFNAPSAIALIKETNIDIPLIIVSGAIGEETAVECMRSSAHDYIMKNNLSRLCYAIARELEDAEVRVQRKQAQEALLESENKYRLLADNIHDVVFFMDMNLNYTYISPSVKLLRGYEPEEAMKHTPAETLTPSSLNLAIGILSEILEVEKSEQRELNITRTAQLEMNRKDGTTVWVETKASIVRDENQRPVGIMGVTRDIAARKQAESQREAALEALRESEARFREVLENSLDVSYKRNLQTDSYDYLSPSFTKNYGYAVEEMMNLPLEALMGQVHPDDLAEITRVIVESSSSAAGTEHQMKYRFKNKDGSYCWCHDQFTVMRDADGTPLAIIGSVRDVTEQKQAEDALRESEHRYHELSIIDGLTRLYNSRHFYAQLEREIGRSNRYEQPLTLLMLDLDRFKEFNDAYGHLEGDHVLSRLGQVVKRCLRDPDSAYRYGGEEFMIMLPMTTGEEGIVTAKRIQTELRKEAFSPVLGKEVYMTVSIGLAQYKPKEEMKAFVQRVDQLMYQAKQNGRDRICPES